MLLAAALLTPAPSPRWQAMFYLLTTLATLGGVPGTLAFTATTAAALLARHLSRDRFGNLVLQAVADDVHAGTEESGSMVDASPDACG